MTRLPSPRAFLALAVVVLLALLARVAWGQEPASLPVPEVSWTTAGAAWTSTVIAGVLLAERAWPILRDRMGLGKEERRHPVPDEQPIARGEMRQAITDAIQTVRGEVAAVQAAGDSQHRRLRESMAALDARIERLDARITGWQHDTAEHRVTLARELGTISAGIEALRREAEER